MGWFISLLYVHLLVFPLFNSKFSFSTHATLVKSLFDLAAPVIAVLFLTFVSPPNFLNKWSCNRVFTFSLSFHLELLLSASSSSSAKIALSRIMNDPLPSLHPLALCQISLPSSQHLINLPPSFFLAVLSFGFWCIYSVPHIVDIQ